MTEKLKNLIEDELESTFVHGRTEAESEYRDLLDKAKDEAYKHGYKDCETRYCSFDACPNRQAEYNRGLNDAWEAARKLFSTMADSDIEKAFPIEWNNGGFNALINLQPQYAIEKLKAYEEKQNDKIEVGDEVLWFMKGDDEGCDDIMDVCAPSVVTMVPNKECDDYTIIESSGAMTVISKEQIYKKTGRHFDIASILEDMRND